MGKQVFKLPDIGEGVVEGEVVQWHVAAGDTVTEDDPIVDVMTDKATVTIPSPVTGVVTSLSGDVATWWPSVRLWSSSTPMLTRLRPVNPRQSQKQRLLPRLLLLRNRQPIRLRLLLLQSRLPLSQRHPARFSRVRPSGAERGRRASTCLKSGARVPQGGSATRTSMPTLPPMVR